MKKFLLLLLCFMLAQPAFAGKIQDADVKTEAELTSAGATKAQLINSKKIYVEVNGINDRLDNAITNGQIGGSPSGAVQLLNGGFDNGTTAWATYKDAAGIAPVDGTGGSPTSTLATGCASGCTITTAALYGKASGVLQHPASNVQGEGVSYDFTIDPALQGKVLSLNGAYKVVSGTFSGGSATTESDVEVYFYDKTNAVLIQPNGYKVTDGGITGQNYDFNASFQTASNSTSYRVIFHYSNVTATAFNLAIDIASLGQQSRAANAPRPQLLGTVTITGCSTFWTSSSSTLADFSAASGCVYSTTGQALAPSTNIPAIKFASMPAGDYTLQAEGAFTFQSSSSSSSGFFQFWDGVNTAKDGSYLSTGNGGVSGPSGISEYISYSLAQTNTTLSIRGKIASGTGTIYISEPGASFVPLTIKVWYTPSIASQVNDLGSQRVVGFSYNTISSASATGSVALTYTVKEYDTHGAFDGTTFTAPESGYYKFNAGSYSTTSGSVALLLYKNGVAVNSSNTAVAIASTTLFGAGSRSIYLNAGDLVTLRPNTSITFGSTNAYTYFSGEKVQGPSQIGPSETIAASYFVSASFAASTTIPINFDSKEYDTHNAVTTSSTAWKFTAPASGIYQMAAYMYGGVQTVTFNIYKNGTLYKTLSSQISSLNASGSTSLRLNAGEYIDIRPNVSATMSGGTLATANTSILSIQRVGL
jgi:hypothetical protein